MLAAMVNARLRLVVSYSLVVACVLAVACAEHERPQSRVDYRETAPAAAPQDMFVDDPNRFHHRVVGTPRTVRGLFLAHSTSGRQGSAHSIVVDPDARVMAGVADWRRGGAALGVEGKLEQ